MAMKLRSGTPIRCMLIAPLEQIDCTPMSYGEKLSMATLYPAALVLGTRMVYKELIEKRLW